MDVPTAPVPAVFGATSTVAERLANIGTRLRERAVAEGTFDGETADILEELARLAAETAQLVTDVRNIHGYLHTMQRSVGDY